MCTKSSTDQEREEGCALGAWEGKIKGHGTKVRASHGLHMVFLSTTFLSRVSDAARVSRARRFPINP